MGRARQGEVAAAASAGRGGGPLIRLTNGGRPVFVSAADVLAITTETPPPYYTAEKSKIVLAREGAIAEVFVDQKAPTVAAMVESVLSRQGVERADAAELAG